MSDTMYTRGVRGDVGVPADAVSGCKWTFDQDMALCEGGHFLHEPLLGYRAPVRGRSFWRIHVAAKQATAVALYESETIVLHEEDLVVKML